MCWEAGLSHNILPESLRRMRERQRDLDEAQRAAPDDGDFIQQAGSGAMLSYRIVYFDMAAYEREAELAERRWQAEQERMREVERQAQLAKKRADAFLFEIDTEMSATVPLAPNTLQLRERPMTRQPERWANAGAA